MEEAQAQDLRFDDTRAETLPSPALPRIAPPAPARWLVVIAALQTISVAALVAGAVALVDRMDSLRTRADAHSQAASAVTAQVETLIAQSKEQRTELAGLRQAVSSRAREESRFLKALILKPSLDPELARRLATSIQRECVLYGRDPNLVLAIMAVESDFNPGAISNQGAVGLMQVMPHWKRVLGITGDLADPDVSIHTGIQILGFYQQMYGETEMALTAYNRGPGQVDGALMRGTSPGNGYAPRVLATWERLKKLDGLAPH